MESQVGRIAELEWANYAATLPSAQATPGLDVVLREDVILTSSKAFPAPDANHACLLRATPDTVDAVIAELTDYFRARGLPVAVYISPACNPTDLSNKLASCGFVEQDQKEAWMVVEPARFSLTKVSPDITVRQITRDEVAIFAAVFLEAFGQPTSLAPRLARLLEPSVRLPGAHHYLAFKDGEPIGTASLLCFEKKGILGGAGVIPPHRHGRAATNLATEVKKEAIRQDVDLLMLQTTAGTWLEEQLRTHGFTTLFTRSCYVLSDDRSGQN